MFDIKKEKEKALNNLSVEVALPQETLKSNTNTDSINIKLDKDTEIKTAKKTKDDYDSIWLAFLEIEEDFKQYMGYGKEEIKKIGIKKFIDFTDIRSTDGVNFYKKDKIKVIICCNCKKHFTTFQLDSGLCSKCKNDFNMNLFNQMCENENENSIMDMLGLFVYNKGFREMFKNNRPVKDEIFDCINMDSLAGSFTYRTIEKNLSNTKRKNKFKFELIQFLNSNKKVLSESYHKKISDIILIFDSENSKLELDIFFNRINKR